MFNKERILLGAALALGAAACAESSPTRAEEREYAQLQREQARTYAIWNNCGIRARCGKEPGTIDYIYAQQNECQDEYREYNGAFMRRQEWEEDN